MEYLALYLSMRTFRHGHVLELFVSFVAPGPCTQAAFFRHEGVNGLLKIQNCLCDFLDLVQSPGTVERGNMNVGAAFIRGFDLEIAFQYRQHCVHLFMPRGMFLKDQNGRD